MTATEQGATVQPILSPDPEIMRQHLEHLFGGDLDGAHDGLIELAWTDGGDGRLRHAMLYATDQIDDLVERALEVNRVPNQNVYVGAALRKPGTFPGARCEDADFYALPAYYVDLDEPGAAERARALYRGCRPTLAVVTGRRPHLRAQLWWRHESPDRDPGHTRAQLAALAAALNADKTVVNPARVMRLAGSVAWPLKPNRELERTELQTFSDDRPRQYHNGELARAFPVDPLLSAAAAPLAASPVAPPSPSQPPAAGLNLQPFTGTSPDELIARIRSGAGGWHNDVLRLVGHYVAVGLSDETILTLTEALTLPGWTAKQTRADVATMIRGARAKWAIPNPRVDLDAPPGQAPATGGPIEILDLDGIEQIPPVAWLVDGYLPAQGFGLIYGAPSSYKSFLALDLLLHVAYGRPWHGKPTRAGAVLYIAGEGAGGIKKRIRAWRRHHQVADVWTPFYAIRTGLNLADPQQVAQLIEAIRAKAEAEGATFAAIAIDTVARAMVGADENDARDMGLFVAACDRIRTAIGAMILGVHHSGKDKDRGPRGSIALPGAVDCMLRVDRTEGTPYATVIVEKQKDEEEAPALLLKAEKIATTDLNLDTETSLVLVDRNPTEDTQQEAPKLSKGQVCRTFEEIDNAWRQGRPWSNAPQAKRDGRFLPAWMVRELGCDPETAVEYLASWMEHGYLVMEIFNSHDKRKGLRVLRWLD